MSENNSIKLLLFHSHYSSYKVFIFSAYLTQAKLYNTDSNNQSYHCEIFSWFSFTLSSK